MTAPTLHRAFFWHLYATARLALTRLCHPLRMPDPISRAGAITWSSVAVFAGVTAGASLDRLYPGQSWIVCLIAMSMDVTQVQLEAGAIPVTHIGGRIASFLGRAAATWIVYASALVATGFAHGARGAQIAAEAAVALVGLSIFGLGSEWLSRWRQTDTLSMTKTPPTAIGVSVPSPHPRAAMIQEERGPRVHAPSANAAADTPATLHGAGVLSADLASANAKAVAMGLAVGPALVVLSLGGSALVPVMPLVLYFGWLAAAPSPFFRGAPSEPTVRLSREVRLAMSSWPIDWPEIESRTYRSWLSHAATFVAVTSVVPLASAWGSGASTERLVGWGALFAISAPVLAGLRAFQIFGPFDLSGLLIGVLYVTMGFSVLAEPWRIGWMIVLGCAALVVSARAPVLQPRGVCAATRRRRAPPEPI